MYKIKRLLEIIACIYLSFLLRNKDVYVVTGMRRSGNHAFIDWFINALENSNVPMEKLEDIASASISENTIHFNNVNSIGLIRFVDVVRSSKSNIKRASRIIISLEDYVPKNIDPYIPRGSSKIAIIRSTINIIASRLKHAMNQAESGEDRGDMAIDDKFISNLFWLQKASSLDWEVWEYESWLKSEDNYRRLFLSKFGLTFDSNPKISIHGEGSSFSGAEAVPDYSQLTSRWQQIELPKRILELISNPSVFSALTEEEREHVKFLQSKTTRDTV